MAGSPFAGMRAVLGARERYAAGVAFAANAERSGAPRTCRTDKISGAIAGSGVASTRAPLAADLGDVRSVVGGGCSDGAVCVARPGMVWTSRRAAGFGVEDGIWSLVGVTGHCGCGSFVDGRRRA